MLNGHRKTVLHGILAICLLLTMIVTLQIWLSLNQEASIRYQEQRITPVPAELCPGEEFRYPVSISVNRGESLVTISEGWCRADGICPRMLQTETYNVNVIEPYFIETMASRRAPEALSPGTWQLRHCTKAESTNWTAVQCYVVELQISSCGNN